MMGAVLRLEWSLSRLVTQDIETQPQINHEQELEIEGWVYVNSLRSFTRPRNSLISR